MKIKNFLAAVSFSLTSCAFAALEPTVWADIPDVAPLRVGDTYYMTSTTMHFNPGIPVMASKDLVDWKTISYCYDTIENRDEDNLANGKNDYMYGTWASSIRFNEKDGCFYVTSFNQRAKHTYLFRAKDPAGPWEKHVFTDRLVYDHSLWIEDGKFWFYGSDHGKVWLHRIKDDLSGIDPDAKLVCPDIRNNLRGGLAEGSQVFKRGDWYYLVNICWPGGKCRLVNVHRSKSMEGPFIEAHVAFEFEGLAQGSFIQKADGSWVAVLFGDRGGVGRIPFILPVDWKDDWPVVKAENAYKGDFNRVPSCVANDEFDYASGGADGTRTLPLVWQWNHNPDHSAWKVADGALKLTTTRVDNELLAVRNILTQRTFGPTSVAEVKVDGAALKEGDKAGLSLFQQNWGAISLQKMADGNYDVVLDLPEIAMRDRHNMRMRPARVREVVRRGLGKTSVLYLKAVCDFTPWANPDFRSIPASEDAGRFYYSTDGQRWEALGEAMFMPYTVPHFTGYRFALFNWGTKTAGGTAAFDWVRFRYARTDEQLHMDGSNPIVKTRFTADPAGLVDGDCFYLFTGHDDANARGYRMFDWCMSRTRDMRNWEDFGPVMSVRETFPWAREDKAWASQVIKRNDKWYWYVAISPKGRRDAIGVAVADKPEGPWKDAIGGPLVEGHAGYIDPSVFVDDDQKAWLFWGNCGGDPGCWYVELKENMIELAGEVKPVPGLMEASAFGEPLVKKRGAGVRRNGAKNTNFEEAPWIYKIGDTYYLEYAAGGVPENWSYSTGKSIHGPWTFRGKVMENAGGTGTIHGGSVFFKGQWYMVYHDGNLPGGADCRRSACIEPYTRNADGSIPFIKPTKRGCADGGSKVTITLGDSAKGHEVSKKLWGIFFEDINWAADGGLNPEMLANSGFDWVQADHQNNPRDDRAWNPVEDGWEHDFRERGMGRLSFQYAAPVHPNTAKHVRIEALGTGRAGIRNHGLDGMWMKDGEPYRLSFDVREIKMDGIDYAYGPWTRVTKELQAPCWGVVASGNGYEVLLEKDRDRATLSLLVSGRRTVEFDNVSLLPTGPNLVRGGLRKDLVDRLADMQPAFVRFPGGCIVEEGDFQHWYDWRRTVGPKERRECIQNRWARPGRPYWETFGVGYYEYFRLCEEIGAEPLPICLAGLTCQFQKPPQMCAVEDSDYFAQVVLDLIEFANGGTDTKWGKVRAEMGHPKPFNLKMVGLGNENWMGEFFDRVEPIAKIIRAHHPEIELIGSSGPGPSGREFDYAWNRVTKETADVVDEHYYRDPNWFLAAAHRYDNYDRSRPGVYAGEYACHHHVGREKPNTLWSAVCEAAAMTGFERNSDIVKMTSYAPLFARLGHDQWTPDLIWFDGQQSWLTPNYHNQCLFSCNRPDRMIPATDDLPSACTDFFYSAGVRGNEKIVKLVNARDTARAVSLNLKGKATVTTLAGDRNAVNTREAPETVKPETKTTDFNGELTVPANSVTVIRL